MPSFRHHDATIHYEECGQGFPILTFAPAGLQSTIAVWSQPSAPINPTTEFAGSFRVIAMDQRNAGGQSRAPITAEDGWPSYTADHIAARLLPNCEFIREWKTGEALTSARARVMEFLSKHTPRA